ncbi:hypothetical protein HZS_2590 [Henneguya salminicola]|nr:hypothetical protein HZS_2590 [Henneguya salminicola]
MLHDNFHQNDESNHIEKIIKLKKKFSDALTTKDIKTISNAIKVCLYDAKEFDRNAKNSDQLLELVIQISKYFKSDFDFYQKMFDQNFLINNPKFYDVWNLTTDDLTKISLIRQLKDANCNTKPQPSKFLFTQLTTFLLSLSSDISSEEFRAALYLNKNIAQNIYDKTLINTFEENYKIYISQLFEKNTKENIFEDTINKTLLSVKPILPGATPTVNTKEARGFLDELVHKPAFDSSDESEGI